MMKNVYVFIAIVLIESHTLIHCQSSILELNIEWLGDVNDIWDLPYRWNYLESFDQKGDTLNLVLGIKSDCVFSKECDTFVVTIKSRELHINVESKSGFVDEQGKLHEACPSTTSCYFHVSMKILVKQHDIQKVFYRGEDLSDKIGYHKPVGEISYKVLERDTINFTDQFGIKRGSWVDIYNEGKTKKEVIIFEDKEYGIYEQNDGNGEQSILILFQGLPFRLTKYKNKQIVEDKLFFKRNIGTLQFIRSDNGILKEIHVYQNGDQNQPIVIK